MVVVPPNNLREKTAGTPALAGLQPLRLAGWMVGGWCPVRGSRVQRAKQRLRSAVYVKQTGACLMENKFVCKRVPVCGMMPGMMWYNIQPRQEGSSTSINRQAQQGAHRKHTAAPPAATSGSYPSRCRYSYSSSVRVLSEGTADHHGLLHSS